MYFLYGKTEVEYLKGKDKILGAVIDEIGHVDREIDTDLFSSVVHHIIGQQISTKAQATIYHLAENERQFWRCKCCSYCRSKHFRITVFWHDISQGRIHSGFCKKSTG